MSIVSLVVGISFLTLVSYCLTFSVAVAKQVEEELRVVRITSIIYFSICRVCNLSFLMKSSSQMFRVLEKVTILLHLSSIFFYQHFNCPSVHLALIYGLLLLSICARLLATIIYSLFIPMKSTSNFFSQIFTAEN